MNNVNFVFYHPHLDLLSDRTFRSLLKKISSVLRELQYQEALYLINSFDATPSQRQSMRDRLRGESSHIEAYYIQKLERGSVTLTISLTAVGLWLLQQTIGESIKEAWQKSSMHKELVSYLSGEKRKKVIERNIDVVLGGWIFDNYLIEDLNKTIDAEGDINVRVDLSTPISTLERVEGNSGVITIDGLIAESIRLAKELDEM